MHYEFSLVAAGYLIAAIVVTVLVWKDPASRIVAGNPGDPDQSAWWMRYAAGAVAHWHLPALITSGMNAPTGVSAMWNPSLLAPGVVLSPVTLAFGPQVSLNVLLTIGFAGSAASLYWVLRRWSVGVGAAIAGGLAYGFSPALTQSAIGHYDLQFAVFPPLIAHFAARLVIGRPAGQRAGRDPDGSLRAGAGLGLTAALQLLTCEELLFNTAVAIGIGLLVAALSKARVARAVIARPSDLAVREQARRVTSGLLMAAGVLVILAGYPVWTQFAGPLTQHGSPYLTDYYKNDLYDFIEPSRLQLVHTAGSAAFAGQFPGGLAEYLGYLGWPMLVAIVATAWTLWRVLAVRVLAVAFVVLEVFSLGGALLAGGHVHGWFKLPWYWLEGLPLASSAIVDRFSIVADGCAAALLALAVDAAWRRASAPRPAGQGRRRLLARLAVGLATCVAVVPMLPAPLPTSTVGGVPAGWAQVLTGLRVPAGGGVLTVPLATGAFPTPMRWQADTGLPVDMAAGYFIGPAGGQAYVGGYGPSATELYLDHLWLEAGTGSINGAGLPASFAAPTPQQAAAWLSGSGLTDVVAVTSPDTPLASYLDNLLGLPAYQSGDVLGWRVPR